ncbi:MAG: DUF5597 domain-containing protein [Ruminococcus sp.]|nr:DUF5597 domain-containing protein [Ruminococcus sp.]
MSSQRTIYTNNGKPWIAIAGEVHNSNSSDPAYMEGVWEQAQKLGMNTLLLPMSWELVEPEEGRFEFGLTDKLVAQARERGMKIVFLWFGTWKNAGCMYAPEWVKKDLARFPRAQVVKGKNKTTLEKFYGMSYTTLSYMGEETNRADTKAFTEWMKHLKEVDEKEHTVIGIQVENETGLQGEAREHSDEADAAFAEAVPQGLVDYLKAHTDSMEPEMKAAVEKGASAGTWDEVFGPVAEEAFSAYKIASYVERVAAAGKAVYELPMSVNCWLDKGDAAGIYPSGGPVAKVMEIWKYAAPSIDVFAPDIYVPYFHQICDQYMKMDNPLVIPETAVHSYAAPRMVYCVGHYHAACFAPFGFEDMGQPFNAVQGYLFGMDVTDPLLQTPQDVEEYGWCARTLHSMMDLLASKYGTKDLQAVISEKMDMTPMDMSAMDPAKGLAGMMKSNPENDTMMFGTFGFKVIMNMPMIPRKDGVCLVVRESEDTYYILGNACMIAPFSADPAKPNYDIISLEEGCFENGEWKAGRRLNGDESARLTFDEYGILKLKVFTYE